MIASLKKSIGLIVVHSLYLTTAFGFAAGAAGAPHRSVVEPLSMTIGTCAAQESPYGSGVEGRVEIYAIGKNVRSAARVSQRPCSIDTAESKSLLSKIASVIRTGQQR